MEVIHRIVIDADTLKREVLQKAGIVLPAQKNRVIDKVILELEESSETYQRLKPFIQKWQAFDAIGTRFSDDDFDNAVLLAFTGAWANGYPMPDNDFGYKKTTYNDANFCRTCGIGLFKRNPFALKSNRTGVKENFLHSTGYLTKYL